MNQFGKVSLKFLVLILLAVSGVMSIFTELNHAQSSSSIRAYNFVAVTPTGTITPGPIIWTPWNGADTGGGGSGTQPVSVVGQAGPVTSVPQYTPQPTPALAALQSAQNTPIQNTSNQFNNLMNGTPGPVVKIGDGTNPGSQQAPITNMASNGTTAQNGLNANSFLFGQTGALWTPLRVSTGLDSFGPGNNWLLSFSGLYTGANNLNRPRQPDAMSNTNTAQGVAAACAPSFTFGPTTFTSTGSVTYGPFVPDASQGTCQITTTGTITAASVSIFGSNDGVNFAALGTTVFTLTSFNGTDMLSWNNLSAIYIKPIVTITTLGGTNIIILSTVGHP